MPKVTIGAHNVSVLNDKEKGTKTVYEAGQTYDVDGDVFNDLTATAEVTIGGRTLTLPVHDIKTG